MGEEKHFFVEDDIMARKQIEDMQKDAEQIKEDLKNEGKLKRKNGKV